SSLPHPLRSGSEHRLFRVLHLRCIEGAAYDPSEDNAARDDGPELESQQATASNRVPLSLRRPEFLPRSVLRTPQSPPAFRKARSQTPTRPRSDLSLRLLPALATCRPQFPKSCPALMRRSLSSRGTRSLCVVRFATLSPNRSRVP